MPTGAAGESGSVSSSVGSSTERGRESARERAATSNDSDGSTMAAARASRAVVRASRSAVETLMALCLLQAAAKTTPPRKTGPRAADDDAEGTPRVGGKESCRARQAGKLRQCPYITFCLQNCCSDDV